MSSLTRRIAQGKLAIGRRHLKGYGSLGLPPGGWPKRIASMAKINRHTGKPHEHRREIARRLRQARKLDDGGAAGITAAVSVG